MLKRANPRPGDDAGGYPRARCSRDSDELSDAVVRARTFRPIIRQLALKRVGTAQKKADPRESDGDAASVHTRW